MGKSLRIRSSRAPTACRQARQQGWHIFLLSGLSSFRRLPLSSNVRPRMPTLTGSSASFETQQRAQRGTSAFAAFCQHFRLWRGVRSLSPTPQRSASSNASLGASAPGCGQHGRGQAVQRRACRAPVRNFSSARAVASPARTVQGLTPRSSGAPTAAHQARSVVRKRSPQPGPGGLPSAPA